MRIAEVIGRVTLSRFNPRLKGGRFLIALPMPLAALTEGVAGAWRRGRRVRRPGREPRRPDRRLRGREAANPFGKIKTPIDAYCACLIDQITV